MREKSRLLVLLLFFGGSAGCVSSGIPMGSDVAGGFGVSLGYGIGSGLRSLFTEDHSLIVRGAHTACVRSGRPVSRRVPEVSSTSPTPVAHSVRQPEKTSVSTPKEFVTAEPYETKETSKPVPRSAWCPLDNVW